MISLRTTPERIAELRALAEKATPEPWHIVPLYCFVSVWPGKPNETDERVCDVLEGTDARFIAAARTAVPDLIADITDLTTENERFRAEVAAKDGEIAELRRECIGLAKGVTEATRKLEGAKMRADTAEAALKAGHAGEVTDGWRTAADGMRRERVAPEAADAGHGGHSVQMTIGYTGAPIPPDLAPGLSRAAEIAEAIQGEFEHDGKPQRSPRVDRLLYAIRAEIGDAS